MAFGYPSPRIGQIAFLAENCHFSPHSLRTRFNPIDIMCCMWDTSTDSKAWPRAESFFEAATWKEHDMLKVTIELPETMAILNSDDHKLAELSFKKMAESGKIESFLGGRSGAIVKAFRIPLMNAYNSGGKDAKSHEKLAQLEKRIKAWESGDWAITERGEGIYTAYRNEVYFPMALEQGMTLANAESVIRAKVKEYFPPDTKATFANFIEATAIERADEFDGDRGAAREAIEAFYDSELTRRRDVIAKSASKVTMPTIDLGAFKKAAK